MPYCGEVASARAACIAKGVAAGDTAAAITTQCGGILSGSQAMAFTDFATCVFAPEQNHLDFRVPAGETSPKK